MAQRAPGEVHVVVGTRSALFLPLPSFGLMVLDEEHDPSYKESQRPPRYHGRDAALHLARLTGAVVILGSATPALETFYAAQLGQCGCWSCRAASWATPRRLRSSRSSCTCTRPCIGRWMRCSPEARYADLPKVQVIDLRQELRAGNRSMFSRTLHQAMDEVLAGAAGHPVPQPPRHGHLRHVPGLRPRADVRALRCTADLS